jgi:putative endonuclease
MNAIVYILRSNKLDRFYIGSTELTAEERLFQHNSLAYGKMKFTATADDWTIFLEISCNSISTARQIEFHIKKMKSSVYIRNLKQYPEMIEKLIIKYTLANPGSPR